MLIATALDRATTVMRHVKTEHVARGPESTDLLTFVECYRGDDKVATIAHPPERDVMLAVIHVAARGFAPDVIAASMETYYTEVADRDAVNPLTGQPWRQGDLQRAAATGTAPEGFAREGILTTVINRAGDTASRMQPYRIEGREVVWDGDPNFGDGDLRAFDGYVVSRVAAAMSEPVADQLIAAMGVTLEGLSAEQERATIDAATVMALQRMPGDLPEIYVQLASKPGSVRDQTLRRWLPRSQTFRPES